MFEYIKTKTYDSMLVSSIVTVFDVDLRITKTCGETHNFPEIIYVKDGYSNMTLDGKDILLEKGQLLIIAPNTFHGKPDCEPDYGTAAHTIISFESSSPMLNFLYNRAITLSEAQAEQYSKIIDGGLKIFESVQTENNRGGMKLKDNVLEYELEALKKRLELFLIELYHTNAEKSDSQNHKYLSALTDYLNTNITKNITVEEMAKNIGVSQSVLRKKVCEHYGCGPLQYFINLKINEAKRLIKIGNMNFTEISEHLGFETIHYFSRQFKNRVGKSPREYLKTISDEANTRV